MSSCKTLKQISKEYDLDIKKLKNLVCKRKIRPFFKINKVNYFTDEQIEFFINHFAVKKITVIKKTTEFLIIPSSMNYRYGTRNLRR